MLPSIIFLLFYYYSTVISSTNSQADWFSPGCPCGHCPKFLAVTRTILAFSSENLTAKSLITISFSEDETELVMVFISLKLTPSFDTSNFTHCGKNTHCPQFWI